MRKLATLFLAVAVYALMGIGVATADDDDSDSRKRKQKPDSIVHCAGATFGPDYLAVSRTVPASVNLDQCVVGPGDCSPCIRSLEKQGCEVVDVIVAELVGDDNPLLGTTFLLSCAKP